MSSIPTWPELRTAFPPLGPPERDVSDGLNALLCVTHAPLEALEVDAIINPTDAALSHAAPLPRRIAAAAGAGLRRECESHGKLALGAAALTRGFALPARAVVHTALPRWNPEFRTACLAALGESVGACLRQLGRDTPPLRSVALPVLHGAGWPEEAACRETLRALRDWLEAAEPAARPRVVLCADTAAQHELLQRVLPALFPRRADPSRDDARPFDAPPPPPQPKKSAAGAAVAATAAGAAPAAFTQSREALGLASEAAVAAALAELREASVLHFAGTDRRGRPIVLLVVARAAPWLSAAKRDRLLLYLMTQLAPLAVGAGERGWSLLLLWQDFEWDMDIGWLKTARDRMMAEAPQVAEKLGAIYILRPTAWLRTLLGMASAFLSAETANRMVLLDTDAALGEHVELGSLSLPPGVAIEGVPKRPGAPAGLLAGDYDDDVPAAAAAAGGGAAASAAMAREISLLREEASAAARDRDYYAARLQALAGTPAAAGGDEGAAAAESALLELRDERERHAAARKEAEAARAQAAEAVRDRHTLKLQLATATEALDELQAAHDARAQAEPALLAALGIDAAGGGGGAAGGGTEGELLRAAVGEMVRSLRDGSAERALGARARRREREGARAEAAALRIELSGVRHERDEVSRRLREAVAAQRSLQQETAREVLEVTREKEAAMASLRAEGERAAARAQAAEERLLAAAADRDGAAARGASERGIFEKTMKRAQAEAAAARSERDEAIYLARQDKAVLANELRARHAEAVAALANRDAERRADGERVAEAAAARDAAAESERRLATRLAAAEAAAAAAVDERKRHARAADALRAELGATLQRVATLQAQLDAAPPELAQQIGAMGEQLAAAAGRPAHLEQLTASVERLARAVGGADGTQLHGTLAALDTKLDTNRANAAAAPAIGSLAESMAALKAEVAARTSTDALARSLIGALGFAGAAERQLRTLAAAATKAARSLDDEAAAAGDASAALGAAGGGALLDDADAAAKAAAATLSAGGAPPAEGLPPALAAAHRTLAQALGDVHAATAAAVRACEAKAAALAAAEHARRRGDEAAADAEASAAAQRNELAKDKAFMLNVVTTLKEQLGEERQARARAWKSRGHPSDLTPPDPPFQERAKLRATLDEALAAQREEAAEVRAAHETALLRAEKAGAGAAAAGARRIGGEVRAALHSFCEKWVPPAAEPEKAAVLGPLKLLEAMREEGAWENAQ